MLDGEFDDLTDLVLVDAPFDCRNERDMQSDRSQTVEGPNLFFQNIWLATKHAISFRIKSVELEIERRTDFVQLLEEAIVAGDVLAVGIDHDKRAASSFFGAPKIDALRIDCLF